MLPAGIKVKGEKWMPSHPYPTTQVTRLSSSWWRNGTALPIFEGLKTSTAQPTPRKLPLALPSRPSNGIWAAWVWWYWVAAHAVKLLDIKQARGNKAELIPGSVTWGSWFLRAAHASPWILKISVRTGGKEGFQQHAFFHYCGKHQDQHACSPRIVPRGNIRARCCMRTVLVFW